MAPAHAPSLGIPGEKLRSSMRDLLAEATEDSVVEPSASCDAWRARRRASLTAGDDRYSNAGGTKDRPGRTTTRRTTADSNSASVGELASQRSPYSAPPPARAPHYLGSMVHMHMRMHAGLRESFAEGRTWALSAAGSRWRQRARLIEIRDGRWWSALAPFYSRRAALRALQTARASPPQVAEARVARHEPAPPRTRRLLLVALLE